MAVFLWKNGLINEFYFKMDIDFLSSFYPEMYFKDGFAIHVLVTRLDYYFIKKLEIGNKNCLGIILLSYGLLSMWYLCICISIYMLFAGWEVRIWKTVTEVLKMLPEAAGRG